MSGVREIPVSEVTALVERLCLDAALRLSKDARGVLERAGAAERSPLGREVLQELLKNVDVARSEGVPICQDCGLAVIFLDVGQDVHLVGGPLDDAVNEGVRRAYVGGYLRKSVVTDPLFDRKNTGDNTPAVLHVRIVPGTEIHVLVTVKGMGSENMSAVAMLTPADGEEGVVAFVTKVVRNAGPNPCPPIVVGIGVGGNLETVTLAAKRALLRPVGEACSDVRYAALEERLLREINALGIGPAGYGGDTTALSVRVEWLPTHLAGLPVAVNLCCHANRHAEGRI